MSAAIAPVLGRTSVEINPGCVPVVGRPHTHLRLIGDPADSQTRVMFGCLERIFHGHDNSAAAFAAAKITVAAPPKTPPWTLTAARAEVLLPAGADDRLSDPRTLMQEVDAALPHDGRALLSYFTFTFTCERLHQQYELVRAFTRTALVDLFQIAVLLVQHAPHRAAFGSDPHVHALAVPRRLTSLGFGEFTTPMINDEGHLLVGNAYREFQARWPSS